MLRRKRVSGRLVRTKSSIPPKLAASAFRRVFFGERRRTVSNPPMRIAWAVFGLLILAQDAKQPIKQLSSGQKSDARAAILGEGKAAEAALAKVKDEIGRASCRERV